MSNITPNAIAEALDTGLAAVDLSDAIATRTELQAEFDALSATLAEVRSQETELNLLINKAETNGPDPSQAADAYLTGGGLDAIETVETLRARKSQLRAVVTGLERKVAELSAKRFDERRAVPDTLGVAADQALELIAEDTREALARVAQNKELAAIIRAAVPSRAEGRLERQSQEALSGWQTEHGSPVPSLEEVPAWLLEVLDKHRDTIAAGGGRIRRQLVEAPEPEPVRETRKDQGLGSAVYGAGLKAPAGSIEHLATTTL